MKRGLVLPVDGPGRWVEWDTDRHLLPLLYREIDTDCVDAINLTAVGDSGLTIWVDDTGMYRAEHTGAWNDVALALARSVGHPIAAIAGVAVVTGGADADGATLGLSDRHIAALARLTDPNAVEPVQAAARAEPGPPPPG